MKASIGLRTQAWFFTSGTAGRLTGWNAQWERSFCVIWKSPLVLIAVLSLPGQGAPILIHCVKASIWSRGNFLPFDGIFTSPSWLIALTRRLFSGCPGTIAGPLSPPSSMAASESRRRSRFCFFSPWHSKQYSARTGRTFVSKNWIAAGVGFFPWAVADEIPTRNKAANPERLNEILMAAGFRNERAGCVFSSLDHRAG